jgi:hypothetical protein
MIQPQRAPRLRPAALAEAWRTFWFQPQPVYTLGLIRIVFGALMVAWTVSLLPDLDDLFGEHGVTPRQPSFAFQWGVFDVWTSDRALLIGWAVLLVSAIALAVGWHSRIAALAVFVLVVSFEYRNPWVFNSGDTLIRVAALILALSPCGAALSLDRRRSTGSFWSAQIRAPWTIRLLQIQLSLIYLATVRAKMSGQAWPQGTAVSYALRLEDMLILRAPHWLTANALLMNAATWGTLAIELSIGILVWNRRLRPWVLAAGVVMHSLIMISIAVGFFAPAMFVLYLAFLPPEIVQRLPNTIKHFGPESLSRLRSQTPTANVRHDDMCEHQQVDNDSSPRLPGHTPAEWIKIAEPYGDQPVGTWLINNGADRNGGPRLIHQQPPEILEVDEHLPVGRATVRRSVTPRRSVRPEIARGLGPDL